MNVLEVLKSLLQFRDLNFEVDLALLTLSLYYRRRLKYEILLIEGQFQCKPHPAHQSSPSHEYSIHRNKLPRPTRS